MTVTKVVSINRIFKRKSWGRQVFCINLTLETDTGKQVTWNFDYSRLKDLKRRNIHAGMAVTGIFLDDAGKSMSIFPTTSNL